MQDFDINQIQRNIALRLANESRMDRTIDVMGIIQSLVPNVKGRITTESILIEAHHQGLNEDEIMNTLEELARNGSITLGEGYIIF